MFDSPKISVRASQSHRLTPYLLFNKMWKQPDFHIPVDFKKAKTHSMIGTLFVRDAREVPPYGVFPCQPYISCIALES